jgi:DNA-directed RNA polymerase subunit beta'
VDVAQDVIINDEDCGTTDGIWIRRRRCRRAVHGQPLFGRLAAERVVDR